MTRALWRNPVIVLITALAAWSLLAALGHPPRLREMIMAAGTCLVAVELALVPMLLSRGADQAVVAQSALVGTFAHLFCGIAIAAAIVIALHPPLTFIYWLLLFYWVTLTAVVIDFIRALRSAPMASTSKQ